MVRDTRIKDFPVYYINSEELAQKTKTSTLLGTTLPTSELRDSKFLEDKENYQY